MLDFCFLMLVFILLQWLMLDIHICHGMTRHWVKGESKWSKNFQLLFLIQFAEDNEAKTKSFQSFLTKCVGQRDASSVCKWLETWIKLFFYLVVWMNWLNFCEEIEHLTFGERVNVCLMLLYYFMTMQKTWKT